MLPGGSVGAAVLQVSEVPLGQPAHQLDVPDNHKNQPAAVVKVFFLFTFKIQIGESGEYL